MCMKIWQNWQELEWMRWREVTRENDTGEESDTYIECEQTNEQENRVSKLQHRWHMHALIFLLSHSLSTTINCSNKKWQSGKVCTREKKYHAQPKFLRLHITFFRDFIWIYIWNLEINAQRNEKESETW